MQDTAELKIDEERIKKAIQSGLPYTITTYALPRAMEIHIEQVLSAFLRMTGAGAFRDYLAYCLQELSVNAKKANTKRVYFAEKGLNIEDREDYQVGMETFKKDTFENIAYYLQLQKEQGLYIKISLVAKNEALQLEVRNNAIISRTELIRIHDRLIRAQQFNSLEEAFAQVLDDSEGAGLGIVVMVLMLKKMGLDKNAFSVTSTETETIARIMVPVDKMRVDTLSHLTKTIVDNVNSLPHFPENIMAMQRLLDNKDVNISDIAGVIARDPAMTADLIKLVNSAAYMHLKRVESIKEAVKILGLRGVKNLLISYGTQKILGEDSKEKKELWEHAYRTAYYAYNLVQNFGTDQSILDDVYAAGILHDMGKIVFSQVHPDMLKKIKTYCAEKEASQILFEDMAAGMNHAEIGALIAEKWNFPEDLVSAIRYHHTPSDAKTGKSMVDAVYLANILVQLIEGEAVYEQIDSGILKNFGLTNKAQVENLIKRFDAGFNLEKKKHA